MNMFVVGIAVLTTLVFGLRLTAWVMRGDSVFVSLSVFSIVVSTMAYNYYFSAKKGSRNKLVLAMGMLADIFGFASSVHSISVEGDETDIILICSVVFSAILWVFPHVVK
jgi:uncharacterized membrane protein